MDEKFLLNEMIRCKSDILNLKAEIGVLEDRINYLKRLYYQQGKIEERRASANLYDIDKKIRTDGFVIGITI